MNLTGEEAGFEKREKELELERAAKRQKLNDPGQQVLDLSFEGNEGKEKKQQHLKLACKMKSLNIYSALLTLAGNHLIGGNLYKTRTKYACYMRTGYCETSFAT